MTWLAWRQFRDSAYAAIAGLVLVAIALAITPIGHELKACAGSPGCPFATSKVLGVSHDHLLRFLSTFLVALPALIGAFWGAPLIARELDAGTHRMVWTQSVSRRRWLATKLAVVGCAAAATTGIFSLFLGAWSPAEIEAGRLAPAMFAERGVVPIAYALFAVAFGVFVGLAIRRVVPAMAATLGVFLGTRMAVQFLLRPHLISPEHGNFPVTSDLGIEQTPSGLILDPQTNMVHGGWITSIKLADQAGHAPTSSFINSACGSPLPPPLGDGHRARAQAQAADAMRNCINQVAARFHEVVTYHPASHYWPLQLAESGVYLGLAAIFVAFTFWQLNRTS